jgi:hypothetical protein
VEGIERHAAGRMGWAEVKVKINHKGHKGHEGKF